MVKAFLLLLFIGLISTQPTTSDSCLTFNNNAQICEKCLDGYFLQYFFCIPCNRLCACQNDDDYCERCLTFTDKAVQIVPYLQDNSCHLCNETILNCISCSTSTKCNKCIGGHFLVEEDDFHVKCSNSTCGDFCEICQDGQFCDECQAGHFLDQGGFCHQQICAQNCIQCRNFTACLTCDIEYFQEAGTCFACMQNCTICINDTDCQTCFPGYNFINGSCIVNENGLSNCVRYAASFSVCLQCQPGYYISGGSCSQCSGCTICNAAFICLTDCLSGYQRFNFACLPQYGERIQYLLCMMIVVIFLY